MAIRTYKVTLDSKNTIAPEPVFLRQGDKTGAVVIDASVTDNGSPVSLSGLSATFRANTADGKAVIADGNGFDMTNPSGGEFNYQVPNALSAVAGKITMAYFSFSDGSGSESTFNVPFVVEKTVDLTQGQAHDYITIIDGTMRTLQQKIDAMNADIQNVLNAYNRGDFYNKGETDSKDAATLNSAKSYADGKSADTLSSAKSYADTQDGKTLTSAKQYADSAGYVAPQNMQLIGGMGVVSKDYSPLTFWRQGHTVFLGGSDAAFPSSSGNVAFWNIPSGFRPTHEQKINIVAGDTVFHVMVIKFATDGKAYVNYNDNNSGNYSFGGISWHTSDPMP
ncbi:BppU family phage baseplate upper protein [Lacticaseibacillus paracasei]|uniref:BppU family phage baseplate upper protein n=1 Tax=Lacticaseibacillus paracasei TaxID=1597 RepID=UPI0033143644